MQSEEEVLAALEESQSKAAEILSKALEDAYEAISSVDTNHHRAVLVLNMTAVFELARFCGTALEALQLGEEGIDEVLKSQE